MVYKQKIKMEKVGKSGIFMIYLFTREEVAKRDYGKPYRALTLEQMKKVTNEVKTEMRKQRLY
jgi:hypothetical protein